EWLGAALLGRRGLPVRHLRARARAAAAALALAGHDPRRALPALRGDPGRLPAGDEPRAHPAARILHDGTAFDGAARPGARRVRLDRPAVADERIRSEEH